MRSIDIVGETRRIGAPRGWDQNNVPCDELSIFDTEFFGHRAMVSAWHPSPEELEILNSGGAVRLIVLGTIHPVVSLDAVAQDVPETSDADPQ